MGDLPDDVLAFMTGAVDVKALAAKRKVSLYGWLRWRCTYTKCKSSAGL